MRVKSDRPTRNGGSLHFLRDGPRQPASRRQIPVRHAAPDLLDLIKAHQSNLMPGMLETFAKRLGVTADALRRLGCGFAGRAFAFPMADAAGRTVGIRYRHPRTGSQWAEKGGREGLFIPRDIQEAGPLLLPEGPTDTAALLGITPLAVVGRPSCSGAHRHCWALASARDVVVCADADGPGRRGAESLARSLLPFATSVRIIEPPAPHNDFRDAVRAGLASQHLDDLIFRANRRRAHVRVR